MRSIFVTGATGAIGSVLTKALLDEPDTRVCILLRAKSADHLRTRVNQLCTFWNIGPRDPRLDRLEALAGDVTLPRLGMDEPTYVRLVSSSTHIVHSAGNVKLNRSREEAHRSAVDSAAHVLAFARAAAERSAFEKLEFVSTVGVAGNLRGIVRERAFTDDRSFRNTYEAAKAEAEILVLHEMSRGLSATIHRPSMVVGDAATGRIIQFQVFYYLCEFLAGRRTAGIVPDGCDIQLDIVAVDYVARAIQESTRRHDAPGRIFHLCSGPDRSPRINDLGDHVRQFFSGRGCPVPPLRRVPAGLFRALLPIAGFFAARARPTLQSLPFFLAYLRQPQTFANTDTGAFFLRSNITAPDPASYLDAVLSFYLAHALPRGRPSVPHAAAS